MGSHKPAVKGDLADIIIGGAITLISFCAGAGPILRAIYPVRFSDTFSANDLVIPGICLLFLIGGIHFLVRGIVAVIRGDWP